MLENTSNSSYRHILSCSYYGYTNSVFISYSYQVFVSLELLVLGLITRRLTSMISEGAVHALLLVED